jgi:hypothetical protein
MSNKMVISMRYEFDITDNIEEYLAGALEVEPEDATPEQYEDARAQVIAELKEVEVLRDFLGYVVYEKEPIENATTNTYSNYSFSLEPVSDSY